MKFVNQSCFELLSSVPTNSVDLVLIDPPYLISRDTGFESCNNPDYDRLRVSMDFGKWDHRLDGFDQTIHEVLPSAAQGRHVHLLLRPLEDH